MGTSKLELHMKPPPKYIKPCTNFCSVFRQSFSGARTQQGSFEMEEILCCGKLPPSENEGRFLRSRRVGPEEAISFSYTQATINQMHTQQHLKRT
jgi:hypothetical protein